MPDPATVAQIAGRLLAPGSASGFNLRMPPNAYTARSAVSLAALRNDTACANLMSPELLRANAGTLDASQIIFLAHPSGKDILDQWFEWISVFPGTEASAIIDALPAPVARCRQFTWSKGSPSDPYSDLVREAVTPLRGLGQQAIYVSVRVQPLNAGGKIAWLPGVHEVCDWVVIRSDRTLIWIDDPATIGTVAGPDPDTFQLAIDAWHRYAADKLTNRKLASY